MADGDDGTSPFGVTPQVATNVPVAPAPVIEAPMTNPEAARDMGLAFRAKHQADFDQRTKEVDNIFSKQQMNVDTMSKLLDDTTASLKKNREGRSNLGLMALGAGMMSSPGNFGTQLGMGVKAMVPAIEQQRKEDDNYQLQLAQLAMRRAGVENAPLQDKLAYLRALQVGDEASMRAIEAGLIKSSGQTAKAGATAESAEAKIIYQAQQEARKQIHDEYKDQSPEPAELEAAIRRRTIELAQVQGIAPDKVQQRMQELNQIAPLPGTVGGPTGNQRRGGFNVPGNTAADMAKAKELGLPPLTTPSSYATATNPGDRLKMYPTEKAAYDKEKKLYDADADKAAQELQGLKQAEVLLKAHPKITGPSFGLIPNEIPVLGGVNVSSAAQQLKSIFANNTIHSVPQGQGAISDYERTLFNSANPSMAHNTETNLALIAQRRRILEDQITKAKFINQYFNYYKTSAGANDAWKDYAKSAEGRSYDIDEKGKLIDNPHRMSVQDYMRKRHGDGYAEGGQFNGGGQVPGYGVGGLTFLHGPASAAGVDTADKNYWRTVGQGALPFADEAVAGVRSVLPSALGGTDYDTALKDERQGVKDFADKYGEGASMAAQLGGGLLTLPFTGALGAAGTAAKALPGVAKATQLAAKAVPSWLANSPRAASILSAIGKGAGVGGVAGFGAGEGGFEDRLTNALGLGALGGGIGFGTLGAIKGAQFLTDLGKDNKVARYLRARLAQDRGQSYEDIDKAASTLGLPSSAATPRTRAGAINPDDPRFADFAANDLQQTLGQQRARSMTGGSDVITGDAMPGTMEAIMQKPGEDTAALGRKIVKRQFDKDIPIDQAAAASQHGQVGNWFDNIFGHDNFRKARDDLIAQRSADADIGYRVPYRTNVWTPEIENAVERAQKLRPDVIRQAEINAETEGAMPRSTGLFGAPGGSRAGERLNYNIQYLHDIKRMLDKPLGPNVTFDKMPLMKIKNDLNEAMGLASPEYKAANKQFGDQSEMLEAFEHGRNIFGKSADELDKGLGAEDIAHFLNDPNRSDAAKDMFRLSGARALRNNLLGSDPKTFTSNWADVLNKPNMVEKYKALIDPAKLGSWNNFVDQSRQLSDRYKTMATALGNSRTNVRQEMVKELEDPNMLGEIVATGVNPHAPSTWRNWAQRILNPAEAGRQTAQTTAKILGQTGPGGNAAGVQQIRDILSRYQGRQAGFDARKSSWPGKAAYLYPIRQDNPGTGNE